MDIKESGESSIMGNRTMRFISLHGRRVFERLFEFFQFSLNSVVTVLVAFFMDTDNVLFEIAVHPQ